MKQIILSTDKNTVLIEEIFSSTVPYPFRNKIIVQVYNGNVSILMPVPTPKETIIHENKHYSLGFVELGSGFFAIRDLFYHCMNTRTDGRTPEEALGNMKIRIIEAIQSCRNNNTEFFVFDSLKELFDAATQKGWK